MKQKLIVDSLRTIRACLIAAAISAALVACGGGGGGGASAPLPPTTVPVVPPVPPVPPVDPTNPSLPIPAELWRAPADAVPKTGNYIYFSSEAGVTVPDFIGAGQNYLYSAEKNDDMYVQFVDGRVEFTILNQIVSNLWTGTIRGMNGLTPLQPGFYANAERYPYQGPGKNALSFSNGILSRGCNILTGWFAIDRIEYVNGKPSVLDMRFEQHCEGHVPALHGQIHWVFDLTPPPAPGPIAPPATLWKAAPSLIPANGNYLHLESDLGNFVGDFYLQPTSRLYTETNSIIDINAQNLSGNKLEVGIRGDLKWQGEFQTKVSQQRLEVGYYGGLPGLPFDPERGGLNWLGDGRTGGGGKSWFMVDSVRYEGDRLVAIDLRFAQRALMGNNELRGQLHWSAAEKTAPPPPVYPPPATLWQPPAASVPASGNYTYLESDPGDYIGAGRTYLYTPPLSTFAVTQRDWMPGGLEFRVGESDLWFGTFVAPENMNQLRVGYYPGVIGAPTHNPAKGGMSWGGFGRGCNEVKGWFVVDKVLYDAGLLVALDMRFEQHCEGLAPALRGAIHWVK